MAKKQSTAVATKSTTALTNWRDRAHKSVSTRKTVNAQLPVGGALFLTFKNGVMKMDGKEVDNPFPVIVLGTQQFRAYFPKAYKAGVPAVPSCFSYDMRTPHAAVDESDQENDSCKSCPKNQFGSAREGNGKGCKEGVKLAFLPADVVDNVEGIPEAPIAQASLSVMNTREWRSYSEAFGEDDALWQWCTGIKCKPDDSTQYKVAFARTALPQDDVLMGELAARVDEAEALMSAPYPKIGDADGNTKEAPAPSGRARKFDKPGGRK